MEILYLIGRPFVKLNQKFILDPTEAFYTLIEVSFIISLLCLSHILLFIKFVIVFFTLVYVIMKNILLNKIIGVFLFAFFFYRTCIYIF